MDCLLATLGIRSLRRVSLSLLSISYILELIEQRHHLTVRHSMD